MENLTFQEDLLNIILNFKNKLNLSFDNINMNNLNNLTLKEAESLINHIKNLDENTTNIININNNIKNIKLDLELEDKIEEELNRKLAPIYLLYRTLLYEKYKN